MKKIVLLCSVLLPLFILAGNDNRKERINETTIQNTENSEVRNDSLHASAILWVDYTNNVLSVRVRHYLNCCESHVSYVDVYQGNTLINFVHKNIENGNCLCDSEKITTYQFYFEEVSEVEFKINGLSPDYGIKSYTNKDIAINTINQLISREIDR